MKPVWLTVDEFSKWAANSGTDGEMRVLGGSGSVQDRWKTKLDALNYTGDVATQQVKWLADLTGNTLVGYPLPLENTPPARVAFTGQSITLVAT